MRIAPVQWPHQTAGQTDVRELVFTPEHGFAVRVGEVPSPGPDELLIRVAACGVCGSDRQLATGGVVPPGTRFPLVMGHEICGEVADYPETGEFAHGQRVVVMPSAPCGHCRMCTTGNENLCGAAQLIGYHRAGGLAEFVAVPSTALLACPDGISDAAAAVLVDAFATPFHAIQSVLWVEPGERVLVQGFGGIGEAAIQLLTAIGAEAAVITRREEAAAAAEAAGAKAVFVIGTKDERALAREVRRWSAGGIDAVLDTTGSQSSVQQALQLVRTGGRICVVGLHDDTVAWPLAKAVRRGIGLLGSFAATRADAAQLLQWAAEGRIEPQRLIGATYSLADAAAAFAAHPHGRAVVLVERG